MKQGLNFLPRNRTVQQRTFGYLRGEVKNVLRTIDDKDKRNPYDWDKLLLGVIDNESRAPIKYKLPQINIILTEIENLPLDKISPAYLTPLYNVASMRRHQGRGNPRRIDSEAGLKKYAYTKLLRIVDSKLEKFANSDDQARPGSETRERMPAQTELPLEVHPAS